MKTREGKGPSEVSEVVELNINEEGYAQYKRLDQFLAKNLEQFSRSFLKNLFLEGQIEGLDPKGQPLKKIELKKMPPIGSTIVINVPPPLPAEAQAENLPLEILYEDDYLMFINKPAGMVVHPAPGNYTGTLVNAILYHCRDLKGVGNRLRPGIVHRLDKGTSGVMVVAKEQKCHEGLVLLFSRHDIDRIYETVALAPHVPPHGTLEGNIGRHPRNRLKMAVLERGGKEAKTYYKTLLYKKPLRHMELKLETGRTHQIRVHLSQLLKSPILMDPLYGNPSQHLKRIPAEIQEMVKDYEHPLLHAKRLALKHPITGEELCFEAPAPEPFQSVLSSLYSNDNREDHE